MSEPVGEWYLRHDIVLARLQGMDKQDVLQAIQEKKFGDRCIKEGRYFFVPVSGFNAFCEARRIFDSASGTLKPIYARTRAELMSKARAARKLPRDV